MYYFWLLSQGYKKREELLRTQLKLVSMLEVLPLYIWIGGNGSMRFRGGSRFTGKGVHMYKGVGVHFADFISFFSISHENKII